MFHLFEIQMNDTVTGQLFKNYLGTYRTKVHSIYAVVTLPNLSYYCGTTRVASEQNILMLAWMDHLIRFVDVFISMEGVSPDYIVFGNEKMSDFVLSRLAHYPGHRMSTVTY